MLHTMSQRSTRNAQNTFNELETLIIEMETEALDDCRYIIVLHTLCVAYIIMFKLRILLPLVGLHKHQGEI